jgi:protein phosphatase
MKYRVSAYSIHELGQRSNQEDSLYPPYSEKPSSGSLFILCDGMGGHASGEVASQAVCDTMSRYIEEHKREDGYFDEEDFNDALDTAYDVLDARDSGDEKKMGTTLTFVKFHEGGCFTAHIGDSRIYHIRPSEKRILHVTRDHSLVNDLIELGEMTQEEAKTSRQKNIITRAMQPHQDGRSKADCCNLTDLKPGDYLYMCSDGMLEEMDDRELVNILSLSQSDPKKIGILKGATKDNRDNHSAILIKLIPQGEIAGDNADGDLVDGAISKPWSIWRRLVILALAILLLLGAYYFLTGRFS